MKKAGRPPKKFTKLESGIIGEIQKFLKEENISVPKREMKRDSVLLELVSGNDYAKLRLQHSLEEAFKIEFNDLEEKPYRLSIQGQDTINDLLRAVLDAVRRRPENITP